MSSRHSARERFSKGSSSKDLDESPKKKKILASPPKQKKSPEKFRRSAKKPFNAAN